MQMTHQEWLDYGKMLFAKDPFAAQQWLEGRGEAPESGTFHFWCPNCRVDFPSETAPTECPNGCKAEALDERVVVQQESGTVTTFPFRTEGATF